MVFDVDFELYDWLFWCGELLGYVFFDFLFGCGVFDVFVRVVRCGLFV